MNKKVKWGILGYGKIAQTAFIPALMKASNSEFYAISSRDENKLKQCQQGFHCSKTYNSYEALLNDPDIDAVYLPLPNALHKEWTIKAAEKGKHVLCEKPLAMNSTEALKMFKVCEKHGVLLMEGFMYRFTDRIKKVTEILSSGVLGNIKYVTSSYRFFMKRENNYRMTESLGGGSLYDVGCYPINFTGMITGSLPKSMAAEEIKNNGVDIICSAVLKYDNGIIASINSGFNSFEHVYSEIIGTKGVLEVPDTFLGNEGFLTLTTQQGKRQIKVEESDRFLLEATHFSDCIIHGNKPLISPEESIRNMTIIEQLKSLN